MGKLSRAEIVMLAGWIISLSLLGQSNADGPLRMPIDDEMRREDVTAEYLTAPFGVPLHQFAHDTVVTGDIAQWNGTPPTTMTISPGYRLVAVLTGNGRSVMAIFRPETNGNNICVVRAAANGAGPAAYRAKRWCAAQFGVALPEAPPSPIQIP